jgi:hypothetical protein
LSSIRHVCRNARNLRVIRYRSLAEEVKGEGARGEALAGWLTEEGTAANASLYVLLRACDRFFVTHGRFPGVLEGEVDEDMMQLKVRRGSDVQIIQLLPVSVLHSVARQCVACMRVMSKHV